MLIEVAAVVVEPGWQVRESPAVFSQYHQPRGPASGLLGQVLVAGGSLESDGLASQVLEVFAEHLESPAEGAARDLGGGVIHGCLLQISCDDASPRRSRVFF